MLVEQQQHLDLASREPSRNVVGYAAAEAASLAHPLQQAPSNRSGQGRFAPRDSAQERRDPLGRLALEQVAGGPRPDRLEQVVLRPRRREDDDLARRRCMTDLRQRRETVHAGHGEIEQDELRLQLPGARDRLLPVGRLTDDVEVVASQERREGLAGEGVIVDDQDAFLAHNALIGRKAPADKRDVNPARPDTYRSWLWGELALVAVLGLATVLLALTGRLDGYALPEGRVALDTGVAVVATIVAILAAIRFLVEGRGMDLLLAAGFLAIGAGSFAFRVVPAIDGGELSPVEAWAAIGADLFGAVLIAAAPFVTRRVSGRPRALAVAAAITIVVLFGTWLDARVLGLDLQVGALEGERSIAVVLVYALLAVLALTAATGFGLRFRRHGRDLDSWLALALTLVVFADLHYVLAPARSSEYVLQGDFLRLLSFVVLLVGVWRAIGQAEFGRAVAEERARVAREIHDGLAQYLFALSTQVSMLESGAPLDEILPQLKHASEAAQQEARFAVLALSSASGTAPFDAALKRYVDFLAADGALDVEVEIDPAVTLAPDEQIEIFRIVQEGLANARRHAGARRAEVTIGQRAGRRVVIVRDDGTGFDGETSGAGQGLKNMRARAASIQGGFALRSTPGRGTAIEVVLRSV